MIDMLMLVTLCGFIYAVFHVIDTWGREEHE